MRINVSSKTLAELSVTIAIAEVNKNTKTLIGAEDPSKFIGKICHVIKYDHPNGVLITDISKTQFATIKKDDLGRSFNCGCANLVIIPPGLSLHESALYIFKACLRNGGYQKIHSEMVIQASLYEGRFTDDFLWHKE